MIQPDDIRRKAGNLYPSFLQTWLHGSDSFFPRMIPADRAPRADDMATAIKEFEQLRLRSKEALGYGYTVMWHEVNSRKMGRNRFPERIVFETQADYLRYIGKTTGVRGIFCCRRSPSYAGAGARRLDSR